MDLAVVMEELADRINIISDLTTFGYPPDQVQPPAAVVTYPEEYNFDATYQRGMDKIMLPVVVMVGRASDRSSRDRIGAYCNGSGASSIKQAVESGTYTAFDTVRVQSIEFDIIQLAGVDYLAATFMLDIAGQGA